MQCHDYYNSKCSSAGWGVPVPSSNVLLWGSSVHIINLGVILGLPAKVENHGVSRCKEGLNRSENPCPCMTTFNQCFDIGPTNQPLDLNYTSGEPIFYHAQVFHVPTVVCNFEDELGVLFRLQSCCRSTAWFINIVECSHGQSLYVEIKDL